MEKLEDALDDIVEWGESPNPAFTQELIGRAEELSGERLGLCGNEKFDQTLASMYPNVTPAMVARVRRRAYEATDRDTYQAMEGLVHNLNTMHSRAGAQV